VNYRFATEPASTSAKENASEMMALLCRRFPDPCQNLLGGGEIGERFADPPPALAPIDIYQQCGIKSNVLSLHACARVQQAIGPNYPRTGVAQDTELTVHDALPDFECVLNVVNANSYDASVEGLKLFCVPRELAQLARAVRSPVAAIEGQEHALAAH
jgi:hypothetical protein